jgi:hypothetical protein
VFSVGRHIRVWILFRFSILFYLVGLFEILVHPKSFLLWPLVGTEKNRELSFGHWLVQRVSYLLLYLFLSLYG